MFELSEFRDLVDGRRNPKEEITETAVQTALQALLLHQCLYEDTYGAAESYRLIVGNSRLFEAYFNAAGYRLVIDPRAHMVALDVKGTAYGWRNNRLHKDETVVLLALRHALESALKDGAIDEIGRFELTTDELHAQITQLTGGKPPDWNRLHEILLMLKRKGAVRIGETDRLERVTPITILPGIRILVPDAFVDAIIAWHEQRAAAADSPDVIAFVSDHLAGIETAKTAANANQGAPAHEGAGDEAEED